MIQPVYYSSSSSSSSNNNNNNNSNNNNTIGQKHWYEHAPKSVEAVQTDRTISNNKPHIIFRDNEAGTCMLIDVAISGDRNVIKKEAEKILKYKDLKTEIQRIQILDVP